MLSLSSPHLHGLLRDSERNRAFSWMWHRFHVKYQSTDTKILLFDTANKSAGPKIGLQTVKLLMSTCHHQNNKPFLKGCCC